MEGSKWFHTDGSKGSNETRFASRISSAVSTVSVQTLVTSVVIMAKKRDVKADGEAMQVNTDTGMGTGGAAGQRYIFKGCDGQWGLALWPHGRPSTQPFCRSSACLLHVLLALLIKADSVALCQLREGRV